jgi:DNA-directed RNA polymerase beta subunit
MNRRLESHAKQTAPKFLQEKTLWRQFTTLFALQNGKGKVDDIDHLSNRRVRESVSSFL